MKIKHGWHAWFTFPGILTREELALAIAEETGIDEPFSFCEDDESYERAQKEGWVAFENGNTVVYEDGEYIEEE